MGLKDKLRAAKSSHKGSKSAKKADYNPNFSPQSSLHPGYSPRTSSLPKMLPRQAPDPAIERRQKLVRVVAISGLIIGLVGLAFQSRTGKRVLRAAFHAVEVGLRR